MNLEKHRPEHKRTAAVMRNSRSEPAEEVGDSRRFRNTAPHAKSEPPLTTPLGPLPEVTSTQPLPRGLTSLVPDARTRATPGRARRPQLPHPHEATVPAPVLAAAAELITPGSRTLTRRPGKRPPPSAPGCSPRSTAPPWVVAARVFLPHPWPDSPPHPLNSQNRVGLS